MARLIDADALKERFRNGESDSKEEKLWNHTVRRMIEEQPTAYNVDKVVEQLEALPRKRHIIQRESKDVPEYFETIRTDEYIRVDKAIEIVRKGGVKNE